MKDEPYGNLLAEKKFTGFPTLCYMDAEGEVLTKSIDRSVDGFQRVHAALAAETELAAKAKSGKLTPADSMKLLVTRIDLGKVDLDAAKTELAGFESKLTAEQKAEIGPRIIDLEMAKVMSSAPRPRTAEEAQAAQAELANKLKAMVEANRIPSDRQAITFWGLLLRDKDEAIVARAKKELAALAERDPGQKARIDRILNPPVRR